MAYCFSECLDCKEMGANTSWDECPHCGSQRVFVDCESEPVEIEEEPDDL